MTSPVPGVVEFKVAPGVWFQIFEIDDQHRPGSVVRLLVDGIDAARREHAQVGINTGAAVEKPNLVSLSEFFDPELNALGLYDLP